MNKIEGLSGVLALIFLTGLMAYVRLARDDLARWHVEPTPAITVPLGEVRAIAGGAVLRISGGAEVLAGLAQAAVATPKTRLLAGSLAERRLTWVTRTGFWAFPDYTTAQILSDGSVAVWARQRYGRKDLGVNAARLAAWK